MNHDSDIMIIAPVYQGWWVNPATGAYEVKPQEPKPPVVATKRHTV